MKKNKNIEAFLALVRAGLWEKEAWLSQYDKIDFSEIYKVSEEQSLIGLVAAGFDHVNDLKVPQEELLLFVGSALQLEHVNIEMNSFVCELITKMRDADIYTILVKGQGIAQCYERPLWRASGDVDLLLSDTNYAIAKSFLAPKSTSIIEELKKEKHVAYTIDGWCVELHGNLPSRLFESIDKILAELQDDIFYNGKVKSLLLNNTTIFLPAPDVDVLFVFTHFLKHFFRGGVGLRQVCDWCRLLWAYRDSINLKLLEIRVCRMGILTEWKTFAALAVNYLGMPPEAMPLYSPSPKWKRKASKVLQMIIESGNLGHNRDKRYYSRYPYLVWKIISLWNHTKDSFKFLSVFPVDAVKIWGIKFSEGFVELFQKK